MNDWQPIETAPSDTVVLVHSAHHGYALAHKLLGSGKPWTVYIAGQPMLLQPLLKWLPAYWMPLPEPPKALTANTGQDALHSNRAAPRSDATCQSHKMTRNMH